MKGKKMKNGLIIKRTMAIVFGCIATSIYGNVEKIEQRKDVKFEKRDSDREIRLQQQIKPLQEKTKKTANKPIDDTLSQATKNQKQELDALLKDPKFVENLKNPKIVREMEKDENLKRVIWTWREQPIEELRAAKTLEDALKSASNLTTMLDSFTQENFEALQERGLLKNLFDAVQKILNSKPENHQLFVYGLTIMKMLMEKSSLEVIKTIPASLCDSMKKTIEAALKEKVVFGKDKNNKPIYLADVFIESLANLDTQFIKTVTAPDLSLSSPVIILFADAIRAAQNNNAKKQQLEDWLKKLNHMAQELGLQASMKDTLILMPMAKLLLENMKLFEANTPVFISEQGGLRIFAKALRAEKYDNAAEEAWMKFLEDNLRPNIEQLGYFKRKAVTKELTNWLDKIEEVLKRRQDRKYYMFQKDAEKQEKSSGMKIFEVTT